MVNVVHQPAGLDFYSMRWAQAPYGVLNIELRDHSFSVRNVLSVQSAQELGALAGEGLYEFTFNAGITEPSLITHDEARIKTYEILADILRAGWKPIIPLSRPRLSGAARLSYALNVSDSIGLDPSVVPTFEEWMRIESRTAWHFYAPGAYLSVSFTRERTLVDSAKPGAYMLTFRIQTEAEHFRSYVESEDRPRWKALLPKLLPDLVVARQKKEAELKAKGVPIHEAYRDPPLPSMAE